MSKNFDAIIIGAGQAGPPLAGRLTAAGMSVALIERKLFGGTCVNTGCTPTKTLVASAYAAHLARRAHEYGVKLSGAVAVDMKAVRARKEEVLLKSRNGIEAWLKGMARCTVMHGHARFIGPRELSVGGERITAERVFINVGGRALIPDMSGIGSVRILTNSSILELDTLPRHLMIVGGSYVGLEFAQIFRRFGSAVTVIEKANRLIAREDEDVSSAVTQILDAEGIAVRTDAECISFQPRGDDIAVGVKCSFGAPEVVGSHVLLAVGRRPNTDDLGLSEAGVAIDERGFIRVDDELATDVPGVFALGDCNGKGAFTHTSYNDFEIVAANLLDHQLRRVSDRVAAYALYTDPPLGRAGLNENEARRSGHKIRIGMRPMTRVGRAVEKGETKGFMKILVDAETDAILGASILGAGGDEAIHCVLDIMYAKAPYRVLQHAVHIHPTVSELIPTLLSELGPAS
jgi:pyruvate/2-oxoglutarate dehydrogenase complex dihydrolipoamide dehydrogenase (E3) component